MPCPHSIPVSSCDHETPGLDPTNGGSASIEDDELSQASIDHLYSSKTVSYAQSDLIPKLI